MSTPVNTILFTPSNEQLREIAQSSPELSNRIRSDVINELQKDMTRFVVSKLKDKSRTVYQELYEETEKKTFTYSDYWKSVKPKFSPAMEKILVEKMNAHLSEAILQEFNQYLESKEFNLTVQKKVRESMLSMVMKNLDEQISQEAKKITG